MAGEGTKTERWSISRSTAVFARYFSIIWKRVGLSAKPNSSENKGNHIPAIWTKFNEISPIQSFQII